MDLLTATDKEIPIDTKGQNVDRGCMAQQSVTVV